MLLGVISPQRPAPAPARHEPSARTWDAAAIGLPTALAAVLCLIAITGRSLGFDEAATVTIASQHGATLGSAVAHDGGNMSGYYLLLHVLISVFGNGLLVIRLPSAVASVATVALVGVIGLRLFARRAALVAGLLAAVSLPLVFWAQNARGYAPMVAFVCAAFLAFIEIANAGPGRRPGRALGLGPGGAPGPRRRYWLAYVLFMALATYSSFVAVLVIPAQLVALIWRRRLAGRFALALIALGVCCLPLVALALRRGSSQLFWVPRPTRRLEMQVLQSLTSAGLEPSFHRTATTSLLLVLTIALVLGSAAVILATAAGGGESWGGLMAIAWFAVPVVLVWLESYVMQPLFLQRNLMMSVPPAALLLGAGIGDRRLPRLLAVGAVVTLVALRGLQLAASYEVSPEPWQQVTSYVLAASRPGDCVAFYPDDGRMAFQYYVGSDPRTISRAPRSILPIARWGLVRPFIEDYVTLSPAQIARRASGCRRLWLVSSHEGQPDGPPPSRANRARFERLRTQLEGAFGPAPIKQFGYASAIHVQLLARPRERSKPTRRPPQRQGRNVVPTKVIMLSPTSRPPVAHASRVNHRPLM